MILGIKYMMGSAEERANYKRSMIPFVIGAILLFAAVNLTAFFANNIGLDDVNEIKGADSFQGSSQTGSTNNNGSNTYYNETQANKDATKYINDKTDEYASLSSSERQRVKTEMQAEYDRAVRKKDELTITNPDSDEHKYWRMYASRIYGELNRLNKIK